MKKGATWHAGTVFDLHENSKIREFSLQDQQDGKYHIVDIDSHPIIDELILVYDKGGWVRLIDVLKGQHVWQVREKNFFRDIGDVRPATIEQCVISRDGQKVIVMTAKGTISLYSTPNAVPGAQLTPVEQFF